MLACKSVDDILSEAQEVLLDDNASGFCALSDHGAAIGILDRFKNFNEIGAALFGAKSPYDTLLTGLTRVERPFNFEGPAPMLTARLLVRRLSLVSNHSHTIQKVVVQPRAVSYTHLTLPTNLRV